MKTVPALRVSQEDLRNSVYAQRDGDLVHIYYKDDPLPVFPVSAPSGIIVSPRQFLQALTKAGLRTAVDAFVATQNQDVKDWYARATEFDSSHPMVTSMAAAMGKGDVDIKTVFELAASL